MLKNVHLRNLALIKEADIDFDPGMNILTGETGAGKSIIIGSITIALGDKASKSFIRSGADFGLVELQFSTEDPRISSLLASLDIPIEDSLVLITRKITPEGSTSRINGTSVTLTQLKAVTSLLVDIHGQHDHQSLLNPSRHIDIIDEFGGYDLAAVKQEFHTSYQEYKTLRNRYREFSQDPAELAKEKSFLEYEIDEIESAALKPGEDTLLEEEFRRLSNAERINESLQKLRVSLFDNPDSASGRISDAAKELGYLMTLNPDLKPFSDYLMDLDSISQDLNHELSHYMDDNVFRADRYQQVHQRLDEIGRLKRKYGSTIPQILQSQEQRKERVQQLTDYESHKEELAAQMELIRAKVNQLAVVLSDRRKGAASVLEEQIRNNLRDLNFLNAEFQIAFSKADKIYENGFDKVEFLISANIGEPLKPLAKTASGGELSRIMLAVKASIADADSTGTLIFDEIDTGISGRTAQKVAEKLRFLSRDHQLICITHLPQIAAMADTHFVIEKSVSDGSTISGIRKLALKESVEELARLLSGADVTENTLRSAAEMKAAAQLT